MILYAEPISPLLFPPESVDKLLFCAETGIPTAYPAIAERRGGGPITPAGALSLANAECLVGLILTQLVRPGTPFLYGFNIAALDLRTTIVAYGAPGMVGDHGCMRRPGTLVRACRSGATPALPTAR